MANYRDEEDRRIERRIDALVAELPGHIEEASSSALAAHMALTDLHNLNDVELFDGQEGHDALHELAEAMRHLRNARRIAEQRVRLGQGDQDGERTDG